MEITSGAPKIPLPIASGLGKNSEGRGFVWERKSSGGILERGMGMDVNGFSAAGLGASVGGVGNFSSAGLDKNGGAGSLGAGSLSGSENSSVVEGDPNEVVEFLLLDLSGIRISVVVPGGLTGVVEISLLGLGGVGGGWGIKASSFFW